MTNWFSSRSETAGGSRPAAFVFTVRDGVSGRELRSETLGVGDYTIGADIDTDFILPDVEVPLLCTLSLISEEGANIVTVTPAVDGIMAGERRLTRGMRTIFGDEVALSYAGFDLEVTAARAGLLGANRYARPALLFAFSLLLAAAGGIVSQDRWMGVTPRAAQNEGPSQPIEPAMMMRRAEIELRRRLRNVGLDDAVQVSTDGLKLLVTGKVDEDQRLRLVESLNAARQALRVPIEAEVASSAAAAGNIAGVVVQPQRYIIDKGGTRLRIGDTFPDGSRIEEIEERSIMIQRDGIRERMSLTR